MRLLGLGQAAEEYIEKYKKENVDFPYWTTSLIHYLSNNLFLKLCQIDWNDPPPIDLDVLSEIHGNVTGLKSKKELKSKIWHIIQTFYRSARNCIPGNVFFCKQFATNMLFFFMTL